MSEREWRLDRAKRAACSLVNNSLSVGLSVEEFNSQSDLVGGLWYVALGYTAASTSS